MDGERKSHTSPTHTREQRAKIAGVSAGTVARYDTVMNLDNKELRQEVLFGEKVSMLVIKNSHKIKSFKGSYRNQYPSKRYW